MPLVEIHLPQIGEGLQEARLVARLKQPGERVKRDEPIYQMETDKAVMDVESPYEGTVVEWLAEEDAILPIGAAVARLEIAGTVSAEPESHATIEAAEETLVGLTPSPDPVQADSPTLSEVTAPDSGSLRGIPPRTRSYAAEKGLSDVDLAALAQGGKRPLPADVDAFLASRSSNSPAGSSKPGRGSTDSPIAGKQRVLNSRMVRSNSLVVPGTMTVVVPWGPVEAERARMKAGGGEFQPSAFTMFAFAVARAMRDAPTFRSSLPNEDTLRTFERVSLGIAVARPGDELVLAVVDEADTLDWVGFAAAMRARIEEARGGKDQAHEAVTVSLTNMQAYGLRDAVPVVVAPSMATIFLGEPYWSLGEGKEPRRVANVGMTFDHRIANGVGAAEFLAAIRTSLEGIESTLA